MSLLLDALKKAANDKEKSSRAESAEKPRSIPDTVPTGNAKPEETSLKSANSQNETGNLKAPEKVFPEGSSETEVLTLDIPQKAQYANDEISLDDRDSPEYPVEKSTALDAGAATQDVRTEAIDDSRNSEIDNRSATSRLTVSDDALSLLIDKTNHDEKKRKIVVAVSVFLVSLLILLSGGLYYYTDMQAEIAAIERKHHIAMQQMRAKTNKEKIPDESAIIRNLVSDAKLEEKVEYAKSQIAGEKKLAILNQSPKPKVNKVATVDLSITKTRKSDPVGENLDAAWLAYGNGSFSDAKQLYSNVLKIEDDNRDAQLGLAAIAVHEKDIIRARRIYLSLLQQDPRDPIATAGLAGINSDKASLKSDNDYLLSLLEKNPDAPHLNFSVGNNYAQQKKWKSAQQYYFKAWQHDSENADYLFNLAVSMDQLGKAEQAIVFYRDSLEKSSNKQVNFSSVAVQKRINELSGL